MFAKSSLVFVRSTSREEGVSGSKEMQVIERQLGTVVEGTDLEPDIFNCEQAINSQCLSFLHLSHGSNNRTHSKVLWRLNSIAF